MFIYALQREKNNFVGTIHEGTVALHNVVSSLLVKAFSRQHIDIYVLESQISQEMHVTC